MSITNRIINLFKADVHGILDRIEEPDAVVKQAIREMEEDLAAEAQRAVRLTQTLAEARRELKECDSALLTLDEQLDLCLSTGNDELAKAVIRRKLSTAERKQGLARAAELRDEELVKQQKKAADMRERLQALKDKASILSACEAPETAASGTLNSFSEEQVEIALLEEKRRRAAALSADRQQL